MSAIGENIKKLREGREWTQLQLSKMLHCSKQTVSNYESGRRAPDIDTINKLAELFNVSTDVILAKPKTVQIFAPPMPSDFSRQLSGMLEDIINERVSEHLNDRIRQNALPGLDTMPYAPPRVRVPIIGSVRCGSGGLALEEPQGYEGADVANAEDYFWLRATGDSMEPDVREGDLVLIHKQPEVESGELAVVVVDGEEGMLKRVILKPGAVILQSANPAHPPRVFIGAEAQLVRIAGKAVQSIRKW